MLDRFAVAFNTDDTLCNGRPDKTAGNKQDDDAPAIELPGPDFRRQTSGVGMAGFKYFFNNGFHRLPHFHLAEFGFGDDT